MVVIFITVRSSLSNLVLQHLTTQLFGVKNPAVVLSLTASVWGHETLQSFLILVRRAFSFGVVSPQSAQ